MLFASWTDLKGIVLNEMSNGERQIAHDFAHMWNIKNKNQNKLTDVDNRLMVTRGKGVGEIDKDSLSYGDR